MRKLHTQIQGTLKVRERKIYTLRNVKQRKGQEKESPNSETVIWKENEYERRKLHPQMRGREKRNATPNQDHRKVIKDRRNVAQERKGEKKHSKTRNVKLRKGNKKEESTP